jgi:hypothetical protein
LTYSLQAGNAQDICPLVLSQQTTLNYIKRKLQINIKKQI